MDSFPAMPLEEWAPTKETLHRFLQVVGKLRLTAAARRNHWWHVPFHLTGRGLTTRPMGQIDGNPVFTVDFDFVDHRLDITTLDGRRVAFPLAGRSVASFHDLLHGGLEHLGVRVLVDHDHPFDLPDAARPFAQDTEHAAYDAVAANRYWRVLSGMNLVLEEFAARFSGKTSPVHHFWHTFDLAVTRFSDRRVDQPRETDPVTREAYSREVVSSGFWFGDDRFGAPALYSYTAPEPDGLAEDPLVPAAATWADQGNSHLAVLPYAEVRGGSDPRVAMLDFYESAYQAGARRAGWDVERYSCPGGITDPVLRPGRP